MIKTLEYIIGQKTTDSAVIPAQTTTTSAGVCVGERRNLSVQLSTGAGGGSTVFTFEVSNDSTTWTPYNRIVTNVTNTNVQTDTRVASITLASNANAMAFFPRDHFNYIRCTATITGTNPSVALLSAY